MEIPPMPDRPDVLDPNLPACPACGAGQGQPCAATCETRTIGGKLTETDVMRAIAAIYRR